MPITRRELCVTLPAALLPALLPWQAAQDDHAMPSTMFPFDDLPVHTSNGVTTRSVFKGKLATGESVEVHQTTLSPSATPHPPHHHLHSEMWLIREGLVELTVNDTIYHLGPGSVGFVRSNDEHGIKNTSDTPATYFVVAVGPTAA